MVASVVDPTPCSPRDLLKAVTPLMVCGSQTELALSHLSSSSSIYWTGPFPGVKSQIEACALGVGVVCALLKQLI